MHKFISKLCDEIMSSETPLKDINVVLPGRRAALFIKKELSSRSHAAVFSPCIYTVEDLAQEMSRLRKADMTTILFEFYGVYRDVCGDGAKDSFDVFLRWGATLLSDFNDIDRYMLRTEDVFATLQEVERIEGWDLSMPLSPLMKSYKNFWHLAEKLYHGLRERLLSLGVGYQGMILRRAGENAGKSARMQLSDGKWIFAGLNAMSASEESILKYFIKEKNAVTYYQADEYYMREGHSAGIFLRRMKKDSLLGRDFSWTWDDMRAPKKVNMMGATRNVGQCKTAASVLTEMMKTDPGLEDTALILADEKQLIPMLSSLPEGIRAANVTMGYPLSSLPVAGWGDAMMDMYTTPSRLQIKEGYYHKDVSAVIHQNLCVKWLMEDGEDVCAMISEYIVKNNAVNFRCENFLRWAAENKRHISSVVRDKLHMLLEEKIGTPMQACESIMNIVESMKDNSMFYDDMSMEYLYNMHRIFSVIKNHMEKYPYVENISTLRVLYHQLCSGEKVDFYGEPLEGLQIMGILETRLLNFKNVIMTGVNEGIIPAGRTENTFVPHDVKRHYGLPTYREKDAIYSYHFFRLLQSAENITLIYDIDESANGVMEPSRFVQEVKHDFSTLWDINEVTMSIPPKSLPQRGTAVEKTEYAVRRTREILEKGLSPSALVSYMTSPMDFYYRRVLGIGDEETVDETPAANTMGSIIHRVLQVLYTPFVGETLREEHIRLMRSCAEKEIESAFKDLLTGRSYDSGVNYLAWEAARRIVCNYLSCQEKEIKDGAVITPLCVEEKLSATVEVDGVTVRLYGIADRIDRYNGTFRIMDYKTGRAKAEELKLSSMDDLKTSCFLQTGEEHVFSHGKALQLLFYGYVWYKMSVAKGVTPPSDINIGVESLRKPWDGCLMFSLDGRKDVKESDMEDFEDRLKSIIREMMDISIPYTEHGTIYYDIVS